MSRGSGLIQRYLLGVLGQEGPMTFKQIARMAAGDEIVLSLSEERSFRRALKRLVDDKKPHRYAFNPMIAALAGDKAEFERRVKDIEDAMARDPK